MKNETKLIWYNFLMTLGFIVMLLSGLCTSILLFSLLKDKSGLGNPVLLTLGTGLPFVVLGFAMFYFGRRARNNSKKSQ